MVKSKSVIDQKDFFIVLFSAITEVWDFQSGENQIIEPILPYGHYVRGMANFAVDPFFCNI